MKINHKSATNFKSNVWFWHKTVASYDGTWWPESFFIRTTRGHRVSAAVRGQTEEI